jgi:uncharacterized damage-inducible protein DinB
VRLVERMLLELNASFDGDPWHGSPLLRLLDGVDDAKATARPLANAKTIAELLAHIIAWTEIVQKRAAGELVDVTAEMDFPSVEGVAIADAAKHLQRAHTRLIDTVARMQDDDFDRVVAGKPYTVDYMLHGLISHNAYHGGQIALLKK